MIKYIPIKSEFKNPNYDLVQDNDDKEDNRIILELANGTKIELFSTNSIHMNVWKPKD